MPEVPPSPPQGAARVNGELEIGQDIAFERRWHRAEIASRLFVITVLAAGLAGLLGRGPYSHRTATLPDGTLAADFEPVARSGAITQITLHVHSPSRATSDGSSIQLPTEISEPFGLQSISPQPLSQSARRGGLTIRVAMAEGANDFVRLTLRPVTVGPVRLSARLDDGPLLEWTQWVLP